MGLKKVLTVLAAAAAVTAGSRQGLQALQAAGDAGNPYGEPFRLECTAYYEGEVTASGQEVRTGICAGKREWLGLTCIVYADDGGKPGDYIGIYEILDTGGASRIREGKCIDIYMDGRDACLEWGIRDVWVQIVDADG